MRYEKYNNGINKYFEQLAVIDRIKKSNPEADLTEKEAELKRISKENQKQDLLDYGLGFIKLLTK